MASPPPKPAAPDANALKLDAAIQDVKGEVLSFNAEAQSVERDALYPGYSRVTVFVGMRIPSLLLQKVSVSFDGGAVQDISFAENEGKALLLSQGNLVRILRANLKPGSHRLHAEFSAQYADARSSDKPITGSYDAIFEKDNSPAELELDIGRYTRVSKPEFTLHQGRRQQ
ncbi:MAG: hypothetical protein ACRETM_04935 [Stenotrophobium sp.]